MKSHAVFPPIFEDKLKVKLDDERELISRDISHHRAEELEKKPINGHYDLKHLADIHEHLFKDVSSFAGSIRSYPLSKDGHHFADKATMEYIFEKELPKRIEQLENAKLDHNNYIQAVVKLHTTLDEAHPFREGNGRTVSIFMNQLVKEHGYELHFSCTNRDNWINACIESMHKNNDDAKLNIFKNGIVKPLDRS